MRLILRAMTFGFVSLLVACTLTSVLAPIGNWGGKSSLRWLGEIGVGIQFPGAWLACKVPNNALITPLLAWFSIQFAIWSIAWFVILKVRDKPSQRSNTLNGQL